MHEGVPKTQIMDGVKEQVMGEFHQKARQADCQVKQKEPYSPWQNAAEAMIKDWWEDEKNRHTQSVMGQLLGAGGQDLAKHSNQHLQVGR